MKQFFDTLSTRWYAITVPVHGPLKYIEEQETLRKRRLLSIVVLISLLMQTAIECLHNVYVFQLLNHVIYFTVAGFLLVALWINRQGHLKGASIFYVSSVFVGMATLVCTLPLSFPIMSLIIWTVFLVLPVTAALFLPFWGSALVGLTTIIFMNWYVFFGCHAQIAIYLKSSIEQQQFLEFACVVITIMAIFCVLHAIITERAIVQADRAFELEQTHNALSQTHAHLENAHQQLETAYATIQKQALTDGLTDLPNHRAVIDQLKKELERAHRYDRPFSLLFFDGDRFKRVNDTYGHAAGDAVLRQLSERAARALRGGDTLGRFGGEEFVVLLPEADNKEATCVAERIRATVASHPMALPDIEEGLEVTVSIGVATFPSDGMTEQELLVQADEAMYISKRLGRNQVRTAEEARHISADVDLLAVLQQEGLREAREREGKNPEQLWQMYTLQAIEALQSLMARHDIALSEHAHAVSDYATAIAQTMKLPPKQIVRIGLAALVHDIGKVIIPSETLKKASSLSVRERLSLWEHTELGAQLLETSPFLYDLIDGVRYHHERWDGKGYPASKAGENIPLPARIIAVAEAYDAMQRDLPYQSKRSSEEALAEVRRAAGSQFDPQVVEAFLKSLAGQEIAAPLELVM